jgi:hypothetical protein
MAYSNRGGTTMPLRFVPIVMMIHPDTRLR